MTMATRTKTKRYSKKEVRVFALCERDTAPAPACDKPKACLICGYCAAHCLTHKGVREDLIMGNRTSGEIL